MRVGPVEVWLLAMLVQGIPLGISLGLPLAVAAQAPQAGKASGKGAEKRAGERVSGAAPAGQSSTGDAPAMDLLEFLGTWETPEGEWVDPLGLVERPLAESAPDTSSGRASGEMSERASGRRSQVGTAMPDSPSGPIFGPMRDREETDPGGDGARVSDHD